METGGLIIRTAGAEDLAALDALLARAYPKLLRNDYPPSVMVLAVPIIARAQPRLIGSGTYFVAEEAGEIVGAAGWTAAAPGRGSGPQGEANVRHVVTDDRRLRRGIGRALMGHVFKTAQAAGMRGMRCLSTRTAEPFYAALGFEPVGEVTVSLAPMVEFPAVEMWRAL